MESTPADRDRLAEATYGHFHMGDPGMDDFESGWEGFTHGQRVEVLTRDDVWRTGTVRETPEDNEHGIEVECDEPWHTNFEHYDGKGASIMVSGRTRGNIWSNIRTHQERPPQSTNDQPDS